MKNFLYMLTAYGFLAAVYLFFGLFILAAGHHWGADGLTSHVSFTHRDAGIVILWPLFLIKWLVMAVIYMVQGIIPAIQLLFS